MGINDGRHQQLATLRAVSFIKRSRDTKNSFSLWDTRRGHTAALTVLLAYAQAQAEGACPRRFSPFGRDDRLFGVLAELICYRHRPTSAPEPELRLRYTAGDVCIKLLTKRKNEETGKIFGRLTRL